MAKKQRKVKAWAVISKFQTFKKNEVIDCYTSKKEAVEKRLTYQNEQELKVIPVEIKILDK